MSLQKILEELWKIHVSLPHVSFKFKLSGTIKLAITLLNKPIVTWSTLYNYK